MFQEIVKIGAPALHSSTEGFLGMLIREVVNTVNFREVVHIFVPPSSAFCVLRLLSLRVKKMDRDILKTKTQRQAESSSILDDKNDKQLEEKVAAYLKKKKGDKSLAIFGAELGISKQTLSLYLSADISMTLSMLQKIAKALGVKPTSLLK